MSGTLSPGTETETGCGLHAVASSAGIRALKHLANFLGVESVVSPTVADAQNLSVSMVLVWGRKETSAAGLAYAASRALPVVYIEDGWIRTASASSHSRRVYSLLLDHVGVYYDSTTPSELENLLNLSDGEFHLHCTESELARARDCRQRIVDNSVTKYNFTRQAAADELHCDDRDLVLIIDQTRDDASLIYGDMDAERFSLMLETAIDQNPDSRLVVRTHPDVVSGRRKGYLSELAMAKGIEISASGDNPIDWLKVAAKVYVGTSQIGYEALLCGCAVTVFGKPFYAGWGLTNDYQTIPRRVQKRSIDELFYAAHIAIARYCHPVSGAVWTLEECIDHVCLQQAEFRRNAKDFVACSISLWKRRYLQQYLRSPDGSVRFADGGAMGGAMGGASGDASGDASGGAEVGLTWSFRCSPSSVVSGPTHPGRRTTESAAAIDAETGQFYRVEDGFLRSRGLGSDFVAPASLVVDSSGLYFDPTSPSDLENLLQTRDCTPEEIRRAARLRQQILKTGVSKYNVGHEVRRFQGADGRPVLLVVGQVADDESIRRGSVDIGGNLSLCEVVRHENPDAHIVFKPHPDVVSGNRKGAIPAEVLALLVDEVVTDINIIDCIRQADEVHTITSLSGFEALLRDKPVVTYGLPFYAGWGLTRDRHVLSRRSRSRTLEELVFMTLIAYPKYLDIDSGEFIRPEDLVTQIASQSSRADVLGRAPRLWLKARNIVRAMRYSAA